MRKWLILSVLFVGCSVPSIHSPSGFPFSQTQQVVERAEIGSFGVCPSGEQVFFVRTTHQGLIYQVWLTEARFVAAAYAGEEVQWPTVVYWGTITGDGKLTVHKTTPFNPTDGASPCDWLVVT